MKIIYTEATLNLIPLEQARELVDRGELKRTENEINYLVITEE